MKTAEIENMGPGNVKKIYNAGFNDIKAIINIKKDDLLKIDGFKSKSADNILKSIEKIKTLDCLVLMDASNMMGRGFSYKKLKLITDKFPSILLNDKKNREISLKINVEDLMKVEGIAKISAKLFLDNLSKFYKYYDNLGIICNNSQLLKNGDRGDRGESPDKPINKNINGKTFVFTGFRNKDFEKIILDNGGKVVTAVSKSTNYLVVKDKNEKSGKIDKANEYGIKILDINEFEKLIK